MAPLSTQSPKPKTSDTSLRPLPHSSSPIYQQISLVPPPRYISWVCPFCPSTDPQHWYLVPIGVTAVAFLLPHHSLSSQVPKNSLKNMSYHVTSLLKSLRWFPITWKIKSNFFTASEAHVSGQIMSDPSPLTPEETAAIAHLCADPCLSPRLAPSHLQAELHVISSKILLEHLPHHSVSFPILV